MGMILNKEVFTNTYPYSGRLNEKVDTEIGLMIAEVKAEWIRQLMYRFIKTGNKRLDKKKTIKKKDLLKYLAPSK
jgi:hypothetical protein